MFSPLSLGCWGERGLHASECYMTYYSSSQPPELHRCLLTDRSRELAPSMFCLFACQSHGRSFVPSAVHFPHVHLQKSPGSTLHPACGLWLTCAPLALSHCTPCMVPPPPISPRDSRLTHTQAGQQNEPAMRQRKHA